MRTRTLWLAVVVATTLSLTGCAFLDSITGVDDDKPATVLPEDTERGIDFAEGVIPGVGWIVGSVLTAAAVGYRAVRKKKPTEGAPE